MKKLEVRFTRSADDSILAGVLADADGRVYFEYNAEFLATGLNLSPFRLPFKSGLFEHTDYNFGVLPGVFDDSLPDGWGLLLMDRHFRSLGLNPAEVSPLTRLSWLGARTMGALTYHPPSERVGVDTDMFDLQTLAGQSQDILTGASTVVLPRLLEAGGSPGGARAKVLVGFNPSDGKIVSGADDLPEGYEHWLVKFPAKDDSSDAGAVEYAYSLMAAAAGIDMPPTRLFETSENDRFFGVKRFDRSTQNRRFHIHTFGNLIQTNFRIPSADYIDLLKAASVLTHNHQDVLRAFRRMVFNVATHNRDDHVKNFAFILDGTKGWAMAPAYDMLYAPGPGGQHAMTVSGEGKNPCRSHILGVAKQAGISKGQVDRVIDEVVAAVNQWKRFADQAGVSLVTSRQIETALKEGTTLTASARPPELRRAEPTGGLPGG